MFCGIFVVESEDVPCLEKEDGGGLCRREIDGPGPGSAGGQGHLEVACEGQGHETEGHRGHQSEAGGRDRGSVGGQSHRGIDGEGHGIGITGIKIDLIIGGQGHGIGDSVIAGSGENATRRQGGRS